MPAMGEMFGLHPWDIERLTWDQWDDYRRYIDQRTESGA